MIDTRINDDICLKGMLLVININTGYYYSAHKVKRPIKSILLTLAALVKLSIAARQPGIDHRAQHRDPCGGLKYRIPAPCDIENPTRDEDRGT